MSNNIVSYTGTPGAVEVLELGDSKWVKVYNDSGAALNDGDVVLVHEGKATASADYPIAVTPATTAVAVEVGVVDNHFFSKTSIASLEYGWVQLKGYCKKIACPNTIAAEDIMSATNGTLVATDVAAGNHDGVTGLTAKVFSIAKTAYAAGYCEGVLLGKFVTI